jgi:hypothetical protein
MFLGLKILLRIFGRGPECIYQLPNEDRSDGECLEVLEVRERVTVCLLGYLPHFYHNYSYSGARY